MYIVHCLFRDRYFRIAIVGYMWELAAFVGVPLGAWLFNTGSYLLVFGTGVTIYLSACMLGLKTLWGFKEKLSKDQNNLPFAGSLTAIKGFFNEFDLDLISPRNITDALVTTFKIRPKKKNICILCMIFVIFINYCTSDHIIDFMYVKRKFGWRVDKYSYFVSVTNTVGVIGTVFSIPTYHHFNMSDNAIILISQGFCIVQRIIKALANTEPIFYVSTIFALLSNDFYAPIRAQITRCVPSNELGKVNNFYQILYSDFSLKVFATMSSLQSIAPILGTTLYASIYNSSSDLPYPWQASYLFNSVGFISMGRIILLNCKYNF